MCPHLAWEPEVGAAEWLEKGQGFSGSHLLTHWSSPGFQTDFYIQNRAFIIARSKKRASLKLAFEVCVGLGHPLVGKATALK